MSEKIEIPAEKLHEEMLKLRQGKHMDFLRSLTGMEENLRPKRTAAGTKCLPSPGQYDPVYRRRV